MSAHLRAALSLSEHDGNPALTAALAKVRRYYKLSASTPNAGEYDSITEIRGGSPITASGVRKPAVGASANNLPTAVFDGTDVCLQPLESGNNGTAAWWMFFRFKPADFGATQRIYSAVSAGLSGAASANRCRFQVNGSTGLIAWDIFVSGANGQTYTTATAFTAAAWGDAYLQFDGSRTNEHDTDGATSDAKIRICINGSFTALTKSAIGSGGTVTALNAATGNATIGGSNDSDTPVSPIRNGGALGDILQGDTPLTSAELSAIRALDVRT